MNWQYIGLFIINLSITVLELCRYAKKDTTIHWGWFVSIATMYITTLYANMLHLISEAQEIITTLAIRTLIVFIVTGISLILSKRIKTKTNRNKSISQNL
jgi:hypothetical protein